MKIKVFLGDLMHTWTGGGVYTIPLNIGYVGSYLKKKINEDNIETNIRLFKDANKLVDAIEKEKPDVVALGFFVWNEKLNKHVFDYIKKNYPKILTIGGGPRFTNINANYEGAEIFFKDNTNCDIFVVNQGEKGFYKVVKKFCDLDFDVKKIKKSSIPGSLVNNLDNNKIHINNCKEHIHVGENIGALDNLNDIPSPYLNGMLDEFFEDRWIPILETNRSCPYRCTFCAWGIGTQKLLRFEDDKICVTFDYLNNRQNFLFMAEIDKLCVKFNVIPSIIKDSRLPKNIVEKCYPELNIFKEKLHAFDKQRVYKSEASQRLEL